MSSWPWESKAAVDARFYAEHLTAFTVTRSDKSSGPGFSVTSLFGGSNAAELQVRTTRVGNHGLRSLLLHGAGSQVPLLGVEESRFGIAGERRWEAFRGGDMAGTDRLFVAVDKTRFLQMGNTVHVFLDGNSSAGRVPDFVVQASYFWGEVTVSRGADDGDIIAQIRNESWWWASLAGKNWYTVTIKPGVDQAFLLALTVILDQMHSPRPDEAFSKNSTSQS
ncbi:unnamed protein product [Alopecurus aequalis]